MKRLSGVVAQAWFRAATPVPVWDALPKDNRDELVRVLGRIMSQYLEGGGSHEGAGGTDEHPSAEGELQLPRAVHEVSEDRDATSRPPRRRIYSSIDDDAGASKSRIDKTPVQPRGLGPTVWLES